MAPTDDIEFLARVLDTAPTMIVIAWADPDRQPLYVSRRFAEATGIELDLSEDTIPEDYWGYMHPEDRDAQRAWRSSFDEHDPEPPPPIVYRFRTLHGWRWFSTTMSLFEPSTDTNPAQIMLVTTDVTEQTEAMRRRLALLDDAPVPAAIRSLREGRIVYVNRAWADATGYDLDAFVAAHGDDTLALIHPDDRQIMIDGSAGLAEGRTGPPYTARFRSPDGTYHWFQTDTTLIEGPDGKRDQALFFHTDVTELLDVQAKSDVMIEVNPVAQVIFDYDSSEIEFANDAFTDLSGRTVAEWNALGEPRVRAGRVGTPAEDLPGIFAAIERTLATGESTSARRRWRHKDGSIRWLDCRYRAFPDPLRPAARRILMTAADVTAQVGAEAQQAAMLETAPILVTITDTATERCLYVSPEFTRFTGFTTEQWDALSLEQRLERIHPDDLDAIPADQLDLVAEPGEPGREATYRLRSVNGWRWVTTRARALTTTPSGTVATRMITGIDIHDATEAEAIRNTALDNSIALVALYSVDDAALEFVNDAFVETTGYTLAGLTSLDPSTVTEMMGTDAEAVRIAATRAVESGTPQDIQHQFRFADGSVHTLLTRFSFVQGGTEGTRPQLHFSAIDVTELVRADAYRSAVLDSSPAGITVFDLRRLQPDYVNAAFTELTGHTLDDLLTFEPTALEALVPAEDRPALADASMATHRTGETDVARHRVRRADGSFGWFESRVAPFDMGDGVPRILVSSIDVSAQIEREQVELAILETSPNAIVVFDVDHEVTEYANPSFTEMTGFTAAELTARNQRGIEIVTEDDRQHENAAIDRALATNETANATVRIRTANGELRWLDSSYTPFPDVARPLVRRILISNTDITDRIAAEALSSTILEATPNLVLVWDPDTMTVDFTNREFTDVTGYTASDLNHLDRVETPSLIHPDDIEPEDDAIAQTVATGEPVRVINRVRTVDGDWRWLDTVYRSFPRVDGSSPRRVLINASDITARVELERLQESVIDESPISFLVYNATTTFYEWGNPAFTAATGFTVDDLTERARQGISPVVTHPDDLPMENDAIAEAIRTGESTQMRHRFVCADGSVRWFESRFISLSSTDGAASARVLVSSIDITAEYELEARERALLSTSPALTLVVDIGSGLPVYANAAYRAMNGLPDTWPAAGDTAPLVGASMPDDERRAVGDVVAAVLTDGEPRSITHRFVGADGTQRHLQSHFSRFRDPTGVSQQRVVVTAIDVTERRAAESALEAERERLVRLNRDLEDFVYIASHDLQEPLRTISSFASLLESELPDDLGEDIETYLSYVAGGTARMRNLVTDLLELSRIGQTHDVAPVDVADLADGLRRDLTDLIAREGASIEVGDLPTIEGDRTSLGLVLRNLLTNALKFRDPQRAPVVVIAAQRADDAWRFEVTDNGIGIADHHLDRVFSAFQRLNPRSAYEGTGIGLAHAKRAVENHGGTIGVESEAGVGSTFWFTIPDAARSDG